MKDLIKLIFWAAVAFFCWGWFSNVGSGRMTTSQYFHKIDMDFDKMIISGTENILKTGYASHIFNSMQNYYGGNAEGGT